MKNILLIAFACKPNEGSEAGVGWNYINLVKNIMPNDNIYVLTWADEDQPKLLKKYECDFNFIYYDLGKKYKKFFRKDFTKGLKLMELYYIIWQKKAIKKIIKEYGKDFFDIVHHITFVSATLPSEFIKLESKFIWGPISSNDLYPYKIGIKKSLYMKLFIKDIMKNIMRRFSPTFRKDLKEANAIIANTLDIKDKLKINKDVYNISSIGIERYIYKKFNDIYISGSEFNIAFIGEFMSIKNVDLVLESFAIYNKNFNPNSKLHLIGDGENKFIVDKIIEKENLDKNVIKYGWIKRKDVVKKLKNEIDLLLFPTCEKAGMVILEAMQFGIPIVGLNYGGPKILTKGNGAKLVEITNRKDIILNLSKSIDDIYNNYNKYSEEAYNQVEKYYWDNIRDELKEVYMKVLDNEKGNK